MTDSGYARASPGLTPRLVLLFMRKRAAEIEVSTKEWIITCPRCQERGGHVMEHRTAAHA